MKPELVVQTRGNGAWKRGMKARACRMNGRDPGTRDDVNRVLREIIVGFLEKGKEKPQIAKALGYTVSSMNHLYHVLGIPAYIVRQKEENAVCPCGCGGTWSRSSPGGAVRKYFSPGCKYRHVIRKIENGELQPSRYDICPVCEKQFPVYAELEAVRRSYRKTCPDPACDAEFRRRRIIETQAKPGGIFGKLKGKTATNEQRANYCWQVLELGGRQVPCVTYQETCGAGCYTGECYRPASVEQRYDCRSAIDYSRAACIPGRSRRS